MKPLFSAEEEANAASAVPSTVPATPTPALPPLFSPAGTDALPALRPEASAAPRIHHQWLPDELRIEEGISADTIRLLEAKGHTVTLQPVMGSTQSIMRREDGLLFGASDPRRPSALTTGY